MKDEFFVYKLLNKINPVHFFVVAAIVWGSAYSVLHPPMQAPDEFNHFLRAWQVSEGKFLPEKKDQRLGGELPFCLKGFMSLYHSSTSIPGYKVSAKDLAEGFKLDCSDTGRVFMDFPNTSYYSPVCYLPQAATLYILRQFNCTPGTLYFATKLIMFIIWLVSMVFVLRTLPGHKWLFVTFLLLPMNLYVTTSFSADTITNILCFIFISLVLKFTFGESRLGTKQFCFLLALCVLLALTKVIYVSLLLLLVMIPARNFQSRLHKYAGIGVIAVLAFAAGFAWSGTIMHYSIAFDDYNSAYRSVTTLHDGSDYAKQKEHLIAHPFHIFKVMYNTLIHTADFYLSSYIGRFGAFMDTLLPVWFIVTSFCVLIFVALAEINKHILSWLQKSVVFMTALASLVMVVVSQHLIWNTVASDIADSIQGRYLIPILPLFFLVFANSRIRLNIGYMVILFVFLANVYSCNLLFKRYYAETFISKVDFNCDMEEITKEGRLKTSNPEISLEGAVKRTGLEHRSGSYSLRLLPDSSAGALYKFKDLQSGDLIEIYAWEKGGNGEIVVQGQGFKCPPYRFINKDVQIKEKSGWNKIQLVFPMFDRYDSWEVMFYLHNPTRDTIYIDDVRYCVKKFR